MVVPSEEYQIGKYSKWLIANLNNLVSIGLYLSLSNLNMKTVSKDRK
jgi:hypothetical protein